MPAFFLGERAEMSQAIMRREILGRGSVIPDQKNKAPLPGFRNEGNHVGIPMSDRVIACLPNEREGQFLFRAKGEIAFVDERV
jgi:hypothetical protein